MNTNTRAGIFQTTSWSLVRRAGATDSAVAMQALTVLCEALWYPIYAYIRRSGRNPHDAEDLTQGFFARLLEKDTLTKADASKGRLRTFLLACVGNYLADEHDRGMAQKRGAGALATFDPLHAEKCYAAEPVDNHSPDRLFQRRWALTILERSLELLSEEFARRNKADLFAALRPFLGFGPDAESSYEDAAAALGMPLGTLKNHIFRVRLRWRNLLFEQVAMTLEDATEEKIKGELTELLECI